MERYICSSVISTPHVDMVLLILERSSASGLELGWGEMNEHLICIRIGLVGSVNGLDFVCV